MLLGETRKTLEYDKNGNKITEVTLHERLPYSNLAVPLVFKCAFDPNGNVRWCDFGDFRIEYGGSYIHFMMAGGSWKVFATGTTGKAVAEAEGISADRGVGLLLRETHFDDQGMVSFSAKTLIYFDGIKRQEDETIGRKRADYFFFLPTRE